MPDAAIIKYAQKRNLTVNHAHAKLLKAIGLKSFRSLWQYAAGRTVKKIRHREVVRIKVRQGDRIRCFFLKRHAPRFSPVKRIMRIFFPKRFLSEGRKEFYNICKFREQGLATVMPVAAGEKYQKFLWERSFILTEDFSPFVTLEKLLAHNIGFRERMKDAQERKILLAEIAHYARKMHDAGLTHCDFNADHVLIHYDENTDKPAVAVYDLQRVRQKKQFRFRWVIKSLAELGFGLPDEFFTENDRKSLLLFYKGKEKPGLAEKIQLHWIDSKIKRIRKHTEKIMDRHKKNGDRIA